MTILPSSGLWCLSRAQAGVASRLSNLIPGENTSGGGVEWGWTVEILMADDVVRDAYFQEMEIGIASCHCNTLCSSSG
jgi:hypothetical protein